MKGKKTDLSVLVERKEEIRFIARAKASAHC